MLRNKVRKKDKMGVNFNINQEFKNYVFKYVMLNILLSFIVFVFLYFIYDLKLAGLMMYVYLMLSIFIMIVDIRIQSKYFQLKNEIANLKYVVGSKK